ncbi:hypothetical protein EV284_0214 [Streptomyces sp. BK022]|uniref:hypothetical protein n=1 Tax=Streptomyces sp. BK022 TaxID=2512123 RepID=UPI001029DB47|nr:hypothetical protein [Streptomyces sp. BK022]RZU45577.1 hypothetical protein EV284_0214 [Streptomyces sp. BK022]
MGHRYYLFGSGQMGLRETCDALSLSLEVSFEARQSDFKGGRYYIARASGFEKITVEANWRDDEGYLAEPDFPDCSTLVYVTSPADHTLSKLESSEYLELLSAECLD